MNVLVNLFSETWARRLGWVLIHFLWEGTVIALVLAILLRLLTNASSHTRYILAGIALLICAIAPAITWTMSAPHEAGSSPMTELGPVNLSQSQDRISSPSIALPTSLEVSIETETPWQVRLIQAANASLPYAVGLWFVGLFILSTRLTLGWIWMKRLCRSSIPTKDPRCLEKFQSLLTRMQITRPVRLLESALIEVPTLIGWLRPTILIPVALFAGMTPDQLEAIFAHELAHVRRYDYLINLLQTILETVLFYHPAIWWISRMLREERENCCDDLALEIMHDRIAYVSALAQLEEGRAMPLALSASGGSLLQRIRRIAGVNDRKVSIWPIWILIFAVLSVICLTKGRASEKVSSQTQSTDDKRDDQLFNDLRIENLKVKDMPLDQFVQKISKELAAQDPQKLGISFVLNVPPGEPPIPVSLDFTKIRGYRANVAMILNPLKARYPIRYKLNVIPGTVYIWQIPKDEVAFDKKASSNPNTQGDYETPLTHAPDAESVRLLVQHGANLKPKLKDGFTLIRSVIIRGGLRDKPDVIDELIKQGAEFDPKGNGISALLGAAQFNEIDTMKVLMDHGVSPNAYSDEPLSKSSALHNATWNPNPEAVKLLLERGANPSGDPRDVNSPLSMALMFGQWESADLLRKAGAHDVGDLSMAAARGDAAKVEDILKNGANVNETDNGGDTPLYYAVRRGHVEISQLLLEHGANVNLFNTSGMTPKSMFDFTATTMNPMRSEMDWGVPQEEGQRRIIAFKELFVKYLADPNYRDSQGRTALHQMAFSGNTMVDFLTGDKAHSADPNIQDCDGNTPLLLAALSSHATETVTSISTYENGKTPQ
jgi:ankyrin repeat protein/beta-lactamase regulating signal transducer with metallopeptidase domain